MKKIIMFRGGVETLSYFTEQMKDTWEKRGYLVFVFDLEHYYDSFMDLLAFCKKGEATVITFNFIGLSGESIFESENGLFFDIYEMECINIVVDHPFYYHKQLRNLPKKYKQYCIDRTHIAYMKEYFPDVKLGEFFPLAGTQIVKREDWVPMKDRKYSILFTGNYTPPKKFEKEITRLGKEYEDFYRGIIDDLIQTPNQTMDAVMKKHILRDIPNATKEDLKVVFENMIFIDLYVRFYFRGNVVKKLVDSGYPVHVIGNGLDMISYKHPEKLVVEGGAKSIVCLTKMAKAKISLNVMPWFKDGGHDRIWNAALNGAVSLTDGSRYLHEMFDEKQAVQFYELSDMERLPEHAEELLSNLDLLEYMAENAYEVAADQQWSNRVDIIESEWD